MVGDGAARVRLVAADGTAADDQRAGIRYSAALATYAVGEGDVVSHAGADEHERARVVAEAATVGRGVVR